MSQIQKLEGIVIKKSDYKENAALITVLTKEGKLSLIVRGAKKINSVTRNYTNLFTKLDFNATNNLKLNTLTEALIVSSYININTDMDKLNIGLAILEKVNFFLEEINNTNQFYDFVSVVLEILEKTKYPSLVLVLFELKLLYLLGVAPEVKECVLCGNKDIDNSLFSVASGGVICKKHINHYCDLNELETKALKLLYFIKLDKVDDEFLSLVSEYVNKIFDSVDRFYERHLDFHSKVKKIIKVISK